MKSTRGERPETREPGVGSAVESPEPALSGRSARLVSHPVFGEGEVLDARWRGTELLVKFTSGLKLWLPTRRVRLVAKFDDDLLKFGTSRFRSIDRIQACRMIEAFRLGIVPHQDVEAFTFGRDREMGVIDAALLQLGRGQGEAYLVEGDYGTGKTHLLEYIHHRALKAGMVTSLCQFDPHEVSPHRPKRVYREIVHNLRYIQGGREYGFRDLLRQAGELDLSDHVFLGPVLRKLSRLDPGRTENEVFWQWIEGESTKEYATERQSRHRVRGGQRIPALYDFSTAADFYCNILSGIGWIARQLGLKGLVLLIDEAETVTHLWDVIYLTKSINFLEGLVRTAQNDPEVRHISQRMIHNQVRPVPYIYRDPSMLLVFATTPNPYDYGYIRIANRVKQKLELAPLADRALVDLFATLMMTYQRAYPGFDISEFEQKRLFSAAVQSGNEGVRSFIKFCVEGLDVARTRAGGLARRGMVDD
ncbi:MAG: BREX system ATP-binding domain-containing protein [candidate division WOR-3 bacterium]